jgi:hypothetical protein
MTVGESHVCSLSFAARGLAEPCLRERCAFWEPGGAVLDGGCVIERLGIDLGRPHLARYLLELREQLHESRRPA